jgi:hypothetical protein
VAPGPLAPSRRYRASTRPASAQAIRAHNIRCGSHPAECYRVRDSSPWPKQLPWARLTAHEIVLRRPTRTTSEVTRERTLPLVLSQPIRDNTMAMCGWHMAAWG